jgi:hypothetical protein
MTKAQFWVLNLICLVLIVLLVAQFVINQNNLKLNKEVASHRKTVSNAQKLQQVLDQLTRRIAVDSKTNATMRNLLVKHDLHVTLEEDGKQVNYP